MVRGELERSADRRQGTGGRSRSQVGEGDSSTIDEDIQLLTDRDVWNDELVKLSVSVCGAELKAELEKSEERLRDERVKLLHVLRDRFEATTGAWETDLRCCGRFACMVCGARRRLTVRDRFMRSTESILH